MYVKKITSFSPVLKKTHRKENWFLFCLAVYNSHKTVPVYRAYSRRICTCTESYIFTALFRKSATKSRPSSESATSVIPHGFQSFLHLHQAVQLYGEAPSRYLPPLYWWLCSPVVSVLDSGAEGPGFKSLSGNSLRQTVHTHRVCVHQAAKLVAALLRVAGLTAGLAESNGSLPPGL